MLVSQRQHGSGRTFDVVGQRGGLLSLAIRNVHTECCAGHYGNVEYFIFYILNILMFWTS